MAAIVFTAEAREAIRADVEAAKTLEESVPDRLRQSLLGGDDSDDDDDVFTGFQLQKPGASDDEDEAPARQAKPAARVQRPPERKSAPRKPAAPKPTKASTAAGKSAGKRAKPAATEAAPASPAAAAVPPGEAAEASGPPPVLHEFQQVLKQIADEKKKKRLKNANDRVEWQAQAAKLAEEMNYAYHIDNKSLAAGKPATEKLRLLQRIEYLMSRPDMHEEFIDAGIIKQFSQWLGVSEVTGKPPAVTVRTTVLDALVKMMPSFERDTLEDLLANTGIGKAVRRLQLWSGETEANRAKAARLIKAWTTSVQRIKDDDARTVTTKSSDHPMGDDDADEEEDEEEEDEDAGAGEDAEDGGAAAAATATTPRRAAASAGKQRATDSVDGAGGASDSSDDDDDDDATRQANRLLATLSPSTSAALSASIVAGGRVPYPKPSFHRFEVKPKAAAPARPVSVVDGPKPRAPTSVDEMTSRELLEHRVKASKSKAVKGSARVTTLSIEGRGHK